MIAHRFAIVVVIAGCGRVAQIRIAIR